MAGVKQAKDRSQELLLDFLRRLLKSKLWASTAAFPRGLAGSWIRSDQLGYNPAPIWEAGVVGSVLTHYPMMLVPELKN